MYQPSLTHNLDYALWEWQGIWVLSSRKTLEIHTPTLDGLGGGGE